MKRNCLFTIFTFASLLVTGCSSPNAEQSKLQSSDNSPSQSITNEETSVGDSTSSVYNSSNIESFSSSESSSLGSFDLRFECNSVTLCVGDSTVVALEKYSGEISWSVDNNLVAKIKVMNNVCSVEATSVGEAFITATNGSESVSCVVKVLPKTANADQEAVQLNSNDFIQATKTSKPTKVTTSTKYYNAKYQVTLEFNSTLVIDYSKEIRTAYYYSYQKVNDLDSGNDEFITTISGVYYSRGNTVGESTNNGITWNTSIEGGITLLKFDLTKLNDYEDCINNLFMGGVVANKESFFNDDTFGAYNTQIQINASDIYFGLDLEEKNDKYVVSNTYMSFMSENNASVVSTAKYTYENEVVDF